ncbi:unnamed protein product [Symbiodinium natans]|uniref:Uncharacterized protein n=1 Tax=Symbiodinium natans TaxID=878477 RepID=A0A812UQ38_9DINO|nr:unnamed protein product [Symbiodinium natans]
MPRKSKKTWESGPARGVRVDEAEQVREGTGTGTSASSRTAESAAERKDDNASEVVSHPGGATGKLPCDVTFDVQLSQPSNCATKPVGAASENEIGPLREHAEAGRHKECAKEMGQSGNRSALATDQGNNNNIIGDNKANKGTCNNGAQCKHCHIRDVNDVIRALNNDVAVIEASLAQIPSKVYVSKLLPDEVDDLLRRLLYEKRETRKRVLFRPVDGWWLAAETFLKVYKQPPASGLIVEVGICPFQLARKLTAKEDKEKKMQGFSISEEEMEEHVVRLAGEGQLWWLYPSLKVRDIFRAWKDLPRGDDQQQEQQDEETSRIADQMLPPQSGSSNSNASSSNRDDGLENSKRKQVAVLQESEVGTKASPSPRCAEEVGGALEHVGQAPQAPSESAHGTSQEEWLQYRVNNTFLEFRRCSWDDAAVPQPRCSSWPPTSKLQRELAGRKGQPGSGQFIVQACEGLEIQREEWFDEMDDEELIQRYQHERVGHAGMCQPPE